MVVRGKRHSDRRVQRTRSLLHQALGALIREKAYDAISVTEILERANVGRSTFYMHFHDKDELLVSGVRDMLGSVHPREPPSSTKPHERIIGFSLPILEHIERHRRTGVARMGARGRALVHEHLRRVITETITAEVKRAGKRRARADGAVSADLLAQHVATTFVLVLNWWVESGSSLTPREVNELFRRLILPSVASARA